MALGFFLQKVLQQLKPFSWSWQALTHHPLILVVTDFFGVRQLAASGHISPHQDHLGVYKTIFSHCVLAQGVVVLREYSYRMLLLHGWPCCGEYQCVTDLSGGVWQSPLLVALFIRH